MFEKRPFLLGLGLGLIAGALLLQLMIIGQEQNAQLDRIDRLNGEDQLYTKSELDERIAQAEERIRQELREEGSALSGETSEDEETSAQREDAAGDAPDEPIVRSDNSEGALPDAEPASEPAKMKVDKLPVRIKPGMTLTEVAFLLKSKGIIEDEKLLLTLMQDMSGDIIAGYYYFDGELSPADVKAIITSPPFAK